MPVLNWEKRTKSFRASLKIYKIVYVLAFSKTKWNKKSHANLLDTENCTQIVLGRGFYDSRQHYEHQVIQLRFIHYSLNWWTLVIRITCTYYTGCILRNCVYNSFNSIENDKTYKTFLDQFNGKISSELLLTHNHNHQHLKCSKNAKWMEWI